MKLLASALWLLLCLCSFAHAEEFSARIIAVIDGDTVLALKGAQKIKIRLANIDAPEKGQDFGSASRQSLLDMVLRKQVMVDSQALDAYGRVVAELRIDGRSVNEEQVRRGMAWEYSHYHSDKRYIALQREARDARRGLWVQTNPAPPWEWRKAHAASSALQHVAVPTYACGRKRHCAQMVLCDEAYFYLIRCGVKSLDKNGDGVPCESLCAPRR